MLKIEHLTKAYAKSNVKAVDDLNLELKSGEIFGFLGPNGAGKTTTIKMLTGILGYDTGSISICGHDLKSESTKAKRNIGYVSDSHVIYDKLTGKEYVEFMADIYGVDVATRKERADKLLEKFELRDAYGSQIRTYSHGMKQKLAIISALIRKPRLLILDEPFVGLDPAAAHLLKGYLRELCEAGGAVFFSTHVLEVAEKLCDTIAIIKDGRLVRYGPTEEVVGDSSLEDVFLGLVEKGAE